MKSYKGVSVMIVCDEILNDRTLDKIVDEDVMVSPGCSRVKDGSIVTEELIKETALQAAEILITHLKNRNIIK